MASAIEPLAAMDSDHQDYFPQVSYKHGNPKVRYAAMVGFCLALCCGSFLAGTQYQHHQIANASDPAFIKDMVMKLYSKASIKDMVMKLSANSTGSKTLGTPAFTPLSNHEADVRRLAYTQCQKGFIKQGFPLFACAVFSEVLCEDEPDGSLCPLTREVVQELVHELQHVCTPAQTKCTVKETANHGGTHQNTWCINSNCIPAARAELAELQKDADKDASSENVKIWMTCNAKTTSR